jgi:hypothetical protein
LITRGELVYSLLCGAARRLQQRRDPRAHDALLTTAQPFASVEGLGQLDERALKAFSLLC